jgi:hypothetical protein
LNKKKLNYQINEIIESFKKNSEILDYMKKEGYKRKPSLLERVYLDLHSTVKYYLVKRFFLITSLLSIIITPFTFLNFIASGYVSFLTSNFITSTISIASIIIFGIVSYILSLSVVLIIEFILIASVYFVWFILAIYKFFYLWVYLDFKEIEFAVKENSLILNDEKKRILETKEYKSITYILHKEGSFTDVLIIPNRLLE